MAARRLSSVIEGEATVEIADVGTYGRHRKKAVPLHLVVMVFQYSAESFRANDLAQYVILG
jgi:hypothetical protein